MGVLDRSAFVNGNDVFLALDRNRNNKIDNGGELFGDQQGAANGYAELAKFDDDRNGVIDSNDKIFDQLLGVRMGEGGLLEKYSLDKLGVQSISLDYRNIMKEAGGGNLITQISTYKNSDGEEKLSADVALRYQSLA